MPRAASSTSLAGPGAPRNGIDRELSEEFLTVYDWKFYKDREQKEEIPRAELGFHDANFTFYTIHGYHMMHCVYSIRKLQRALMGGWKVDGGNRDYEHVVHCTNFLKDSRTPFEEFDVQTHIKYPAC